MQNTTEVFNKLVHIVCQHILSSKYALLDISRVIWNMFPVTLLKRFPENKIILSSSF